MDENITAAPPAPAPTPAAVPAAPPAPPAPPQDVPPGHWTPGLATSAILVALLAFLLGSFRASNTDIWLYLGAGKLLAQGQYQFGVDPFSWASDGGYWANPSWLSSWIAYVIYLGLGSSVLVIIKALLIVAAAAFLFNARAKDAPLLPAIELTALAIAAASPRYFLQPAVLSFTALAALLWLLTRGGFLGGLSSEEKPRPGAIWQIPLLFLAWSNFDGYFILGLAAVGATVLGLAPFAAARTEARRLAVIFALSVAACALNPHLFNNFTLPTDLAFIFADLLPADWVAAGRAVVVFNEGDPGFYRVASPFSSIGLADSFNFVGLAFYLLVLVNIASFVVCFFVPGQSAFASRVLLGALFFVLAGMQIRLIPFYAFAAATLSILNFTDYVRWSRIGDTIPLRGRRFARGTTFAFLLAAVFLAWPGWLHLNLSQFHHDALFQSPRRADWEAPVDASLQHAALTLKEGVAAGEVHNVVNFSFDIAHYCAFFAPEVKCGIDLRLGLFAGKAREYSALRNDLLTEALEKFDAKLKPAQHTWPKTLEDWNVDTFVLTHYDRIVNEAWLKLTFSLFQQPTLWKPIVADGQTLVFLLSPVRGWPEDYLFSTWRRAAFAPTPEADWLPDEPLIPPREVIWLDLYARGVGAMPPESAAAVFEFNWFQQYSTLWLPAYFSAFQATHFLPAAGHLGAVPGHILGLQGAHVFALGEDVFRHPAGPDPTWFHSVDLGPAALPILAQRNLRRSIATNPNLAATHAMLAQNVALIQRQEGWWNRRQSPPLRMELRTVETVASLRNAVNLAPHNPNFRWQLAEALFNENYRDASLEQIKEGIKAFDSLPVTDLNLKKRAALEKEYKRFEALLKKRLDDFDLKAAGVSDMQKFRIAVREPWRYTDLDNQTQTDPAGRGLVLQGLRILEKINPASLSEDEKIERNYFRIRLNCFQGNIQEALDLYNQVKDDLGVRSLDCMLWIAAATGWYKNLDEVLRVLENNQADLVARLTPGMLNLAVQSLGLSQLPELPTGPRITHGVFIERMLWIQSDQFNDAAARLADFRTLRGIYALERGDVVRARVHFDQAIAGGVPFLDKPIALRYSELLREQAEK